MNSQNEPVGEEYIVTYKLNDYQRGSLVTRFEGKPSQAQLRSLLADYSITGGLSEVSARPAPRLSNASRLSTTTPPQPTTISKARPAAGAFDMLKNQGGFDFGQFATTSGNKKEVASRKTTGDSSTSNTGKVVSTMLSFFFLLVFFIAAIIFG